MIRMLLGHKTRHMMDKYAKLQVETVRRALEQRRPQTVRKFKAEVE